MPPFRRRRERDQSPSETGPNLPPLSRDAAKVFDRFLRAGALPEAALEALPQGDAVALLAAIVAWHTGQIARADRLLAELRANRAGLEYNRRLMEAVLEALRRGATLGAPAALALAEVEG